MSRVHLDTLTRIESAIAEAVTRIEHQRQMIADFQSQGYDMRPPLTLLSCLLVNLRTLEDKRREELRTDAVAL